MRKVILSIAASFWVAGCVPLVVGGAAETAAVVAQERSVGNAVDDAGTLIKIKDQFLASNNMDVLQNVEVKVVEGRVLLTGNVDQPDSQIEAVRLAWQVDGVTEVINEIQINDQSGIWNYTRDVWISTQIRSRMLFAKDIRSVNYSVITVNQVVYLMGIAQDQGEMNRANHIASTTSYVKRVVNYARLKNDPRRPRTAN